VRAWIFRNRQRLEAIYGRPGRLRPLTEPAGPAPAAEPDVRLAPPRPRPARVVVYHLRPLPPYLRRAG